MYALALHEVQSCKEKRAAKNTGFYKTEEIALKTNLQGIHATILSLAS